MKTSVRLIHSLIIFCCILFLYSCTLPAEQEKETKAKPENKEIPCGMKGDKQLFKGLNGGCFYYNKKGNRTYINRLDCKC